MSSFDAPGALERSLTEAVARFAALARERKADPAAVAALLAAGQVEGRPAPRLDAALDLATRAGILT